MTPVKQATKTIFVVETPGGEKVFMIKVEAERFACFLDMENYLSEDAIEQIENCPEEWQALSSIFIRLVFTL